MLSGLALAVALEAAPGSPSAEFSKAWTPDRSACKASGLGLPEDVASVRTVLWEKRASLKSYCLMEAGALWAATDPDRGYRLFLMGRMRYAYDKRRCGDPDARNTYDSAHWAMTATFSQAFITATPERAKAVEIVKQLAADPGLFSADPPGEDVCEESDGVVASKRWPKIQETIRREMLSAASKPTSP